MHKTAYVAKKPDANGIIPYTPEENAVWQELIERQIPIVEKRACSEYLKGLEILDFSHQHIPQMNEVSDKLKRTTGWSVVQVPALITPEHFFHLLAQREFPAATFIRHPEELEYLQEPDIFHEFFGHCPMLTDPEYADFMQKYGALSQNASKEAISLLARIYWFTVEFGLIKTDPGIRVYGGGILSSMGETPYSLESKEAERKPFELMEVIRTAYRIDIKQPLYYVIPSFKDLYQLYPVLKNDMKKLCEVVGKSGMLPPLFPTGKDVTVY